MGVLLYRKRFRSERISSIFYEFLQLNLSRQKNMGHGCPVTPFSPCPKLGLITKAMLSGHQ